MTVTTWRQPDDLWTYRLEDACETCGGHAFCDCGGNDPSWANPSGMRTAILCRRCDEGKNCPTCNGTGTVAYSQHGFHSRRVALIRAKQVIRERSLPARCGEETIEA